MSFYVYILRCADGSYYANLEIRLAAHQRGEIEGYTRKRRPVELIFAEEFYSRDEALSRERQLKGWSRAKKEALIKGNWDALRRLSRTHRRADASSDLRPSTSSGRTGSSFR